MRRLIATVTLALAAAGGVGLPVPPAHASDRVAHYQTKAKYDTVREDLMFAIQGRGLVIDHTSYIANMLERTGKDVGAGKKVYAKGEAMQFCSAVVSRRMMEADPRLMAYCPYVIAVYELAGQPGTVHVVYRRVGGDAPAAAGAALGEVDKLLDGIAREAAGLK